MTPVEQKKAAKAFVGRWKAAEGNELREANSFWIELCSQVLGIANPTQRLDFERKVKGRRIDVFYEDMGILIESKSRGVDLDAPEQRGKDKHGSPRMVTPYEQARWYADHITPRSVAPKWIITCNFDLMRIYDLDDEDCEDNYETLALNELPTMIHRLTGPLFYDALKDELTAIEGLKTEKERKFKLNAFRQKIASLKFLDPACGSGNFLTETYLSLRKLENRVLEDFYGGQMVMGDFDPIQVSLDQFYGIEINGFAVEVAKTALWIAELQMLDQTREILSMWIDPLPLKSNDNIACANALQTDWNDVLPANDCSYMIGNPPFIGHQWRTKEQQADMAAVFEGWSNYGKLDYVAAWYAKAAEYGKDSNVPFAFVSTNSICQGEVVRTLWEPLLDMGYAITFAYPTFVWNSEAADQAHVHVVIVGCSNGEAEGGRTIFYSDEARKVGNINGYLADAPNIFIESRGNPVNPGSPKMTKGSQPTDGGNLILSEGEKQKLETAHPELSEVIHQFMGGKEFINGLVRYCLWFDGCDMSEYSLIPEIRERLDAVRSMRESSPTASVQRDAATPWLFTQNRQPSDYFIALPTVSSARREYIPVGYLGPEIIVSDQLRFIPTSDKFILGLLMSKTHNAWMRVVCGRLKSDYRYAPAVWNSLVWPQASDSQKADIVSGAISVLDVRGNYPDASLATLYDPDKMPDDLKAAHTALDAAVEAAYGVNFNGDEEKIVAHLFKLYAEMTEGGK